MIVEPLFSPEDSDLAKLTWYTSGNDVYAKRSVWNGKGNTKLRAHRIVLSRMLGRELEKNELADHANGKVLDCRRSNLRVTNVSGNQQARKSNPFRNTTWHKQFNRWQAHITVNNKCIYLGLFDSREEAAKEASNARKQYNFLERQAQ